MVSPRLYSASNRRTNWAKKFYCKFMLSATGGTPWISYHRPLQSDELCNILCISFLSPEFWVPMVAILVTKRLYDSSVLHLNSLTLQTSTSDCATFV